MASIRTEAQDVLSIARDGIGWIAVWKDRQNGRSWNAMAFWPDFDERTNTAKLEDFERDQLQNMAALDPNAIIVNSYYHNLGATDCMTRETLADALRWQYEAGRETVAKFLEIVETA